jgi:hypothetical protein
MRPSTVHTATASLIDAVTKVDGDLVRVDVIKP